MAKIESVGVSEAEDFDKKSRELKRELQKLTSEVLEADEDVDNDDNNDHTTRIILGKIDNAIKAFAALKLLKKKEHSISCKADDFIVPNEFRCPLSNAIMKDPVILSTGQTYDRPYIQKWFNDGNRTCPQTQQVLSSFELTPNRLVHELITQWCKDHGIELPPPVEDINVGTLLTDADRKHISSLLAKIASGSLSDQKEAAKDLRTLTKRTSSARSFFRESPDALEQFLRPLTPAKGLKKVDHHPDLQEDLMATLLNISIPDENKKLIADYLPAVTALTESLQRGNMQTRAHAAAALFSLSALDDNKLRIGKLDAFRPLIDLLKQGNEIVLKDAATALYSLCKHPENIGIAVSQGAVKVIFDKIKDGVLVSGLLATLVLLSNNRKAITTLEKLNAAECLLTIIRESKVEGDRENCVSILHDICQQSRSALRVVRDDEKTNKTLSLLADDGTSRARRKADSILDKLRPQKQVLSSTHSA